MRSRAATPGRTAVRDASDAEPGSPAQTIAPADSSVQREGAPGADAPTVATPAAEPYRAGLIWKSRGRSRVAEVPATPAMRACIDQAFVESLPKLALRAAVPVGVALIVLGLGFVPVVFGLFIVAITTLSSGTVGALIHTLGLLSAKRHPSVVRVIGPMRAREREIRSKNSRTVERHLDVGDYDEIAIDESTYYEIGHAVAFSHEIELPWPTPPEDSSCYEMDAAIVTYSQTMSRLVFDVRHPDGARIWRHHGYDDAAWNASAP